MTPYLALLPARSAAQDLQTQATLAALDIDVAFVGGSVSAPPTPGAVFVHAGSGPRWPALAQALAAHWPLVSQYRYVWLPEATLEMAPEALARLFAICAHLGLDLAQPAFTPASRCAHPIAWQHDAFQVRFTDFVDAAAPLLSIEMLTQVLPTFDSVNDGNTLGRVWPQLTRSGRVAIVDATPAQRPTAVGGESGDADDLPAINLGGLLDSGDALCLSERAADVDALLEALMQSTAAWPLGASRATRYLACHLDGAADPARAAIPLALEAALSGAELQFNCVVQPHRASVPGSAPAAVQPAAHAELLALTAQVQALTQQLAQVRPTVPDPQRNTPDDREHALRDADLHDLRTRYAAVVADRDRQAALLTELAGQLARAQYHCRELAQSAGAGAAR